MDAGYDDIDFVSDITTEELQDIGITKKGTIIVCDGCNVDPLGKHLITLIHVNTSEQGV